MEPLTEQESLTPNPSPNGRGGEFYFHFSPMGEGRVFTFTFLPMGEGEGFCPMLILQARG